MTHRIRRAVRAPVGSSVSGRRGRPRLRSAGLSLALVALGACGAGAPEAADPHAEEEARASTVETVALSQADAEAGGVALAVARSGPLSDVLRLPAEVRFDPDRLARISTPVSGVITDLRAAEGARVKAGAVLAVLSSRELAGLKSDYLDSVAAERLARSEAGREETLWRERATSEASVQTARASLHRAEAAREAAETKLHAIAIGHDVLDDLTSSADGANATYRLVSPIDGQVVQRDATIGEAVGSGENAEKPLFTVADSSRVWVDISVYRQDLGRIAVGSAAQLLDDSGAVVSAGVLSFISPVIDETSRTATARMVLDNPDGRLKPGQFATALLDAGAGKPALLVEPGAIQSIDGAPAVFVEAPGGFAVRPVKTGRTGREGVEVLEGLAEGDRYVASGSFLLKAELEKSSAGDGHIH